MVGTNHCCSEVTEPGNAEPYRSPSLLCCQLQSIITSLEQAEQCGSQLHVQFLGQSSTPHEVRDGVTSAMPLVYLLALLVLLVALVRQRRPSTDLTGSGGERDWQPDLARQAYGTLEGDTLTLHDVRNSRYPDPGEPYDVAWEARQYDLNKVTRLWFLIASFSRFEAVAHTFLSFEFENGQFLAVSVEARPEEGKEYNLVEGVLRHYELSYVFGDERDLILRRTLYQDTEVYLYPLVTPPREVRSLLERMVETANSLRRHARFYNSVTSNCTSVLRVHANEVRPGSFRSFALAQVMPGISDRVLYRRGWIDTNLPFEEIREHFAVQKKSKQCEPDENFSACIREGLTE